MYGDALARRVYQQALALNTQVEVLIERAELARFHLRDQLDRDATFVALACGRALAEAAPAERRRLYRAARPRAIECATILDILQARARRRAPVDEPQALVAELADALAVLASR